MRNNQMGWCTAVMHVSACGWILMCVVFTYFDWISVLEKELYVRVLFVVQYDVSVKCHDKIFNKYVKHQGQISSKVTQKTGLEMREGKLYRCDKIIKSLGVSNRLPDYF